MDNQKRFDVSPPGNQPADQTSRPIIVSRDQSTQDPMVRSKDFSARRTDAIKPIIAAETSHDKPAESLPANKPAIGYSGAEQSQQTQSEQSQPDPSSLSDHDLPASVIANQPSKEAPSIPDDKVQQLINKKTYNLPIQASKTKRTAVIVIILVCILAVACGVAAYIIIN